MAETQSQKSKPTSREFRYELEIKQDNAPPYTKLYEVTCGTSGVLMGSGGFDPPQ